MFTIIYIVRKIRYVRTIAILSFPRYLKNFGKTGLQIISEEVADRLVRDYSDVKDLRVSKNQKKGK